METPPPQSLPFCYKVNTLMLKYDFGIRFIIEPCSIKQKKRKSEVSLKIGHRPSAMGTSRGFLRTTLKTLLCSMCLCPFNQKVWQPTEKRGRTYFLSTRSRVYLIFRNCI